MKHEHTPVWVNSSNLPGFLVLRCSCGETFGQRRLGRPRIS